MAAMTLLEQLEVWKRAGRYQVTMVYGEGVGCDDFDVPTLSRTLVVWAHPVGALGECKVLYRGTVAGFLRFDLAAHRPVRLSNPPDRESLQIPGFYIWGTDRMVPGVLKDFWGRCPDRYSQEEQSCI